MKLNKEQEIRAHADDLSHCRDAMRVGSKSFYMASRLLPMDVRDATIAVYAFCRLSDDAVDEVSNGPAALAGLNRRLDAIYAGAPEDHPVDRAVSATVQRFDVPRDVLDALLEGMAWDAAGREYETLDDVIDYSVRVAGSVGMLVCCIMGRREPDVLARACDLGIAMQLTNIARDVGEDARMGRCYLPAAWLREAGLDPHAWRKSPVHDARLAVVVQRLLENADAYYQRAEDGISELPLACRPAIFMARHCYAEIGHQVRRRRFDSVSGRAVVGTSRKLWLLTRVARSMLTAQGLGPRIRRGNNVVHARYLIDGVAVMPAQDACRPMAWWQLGRRVEWTIDLFIRLEDKERASVSETVTRRATT